MGYSDPRLSHGNKPPPLMALAYALAGALAAGVAWAGMSFLRESAHMRSVPERVMEGVLLLTPVDAAATVLQRFGFEAKIYAFYASTAAVLLLLAALGNFALRRHWSEAQILGLGLALWLFAMGVLLPMSEAGFFGLGLVDGPLPAIIGHLAVVLTYCGVLLVARACFERLELLLESRRAPSGELGWEAVVAGPGFLTRRSAAMLIGGTFAAYGVTLLTERFGPKPQPTRIVIRDRAEEAATPVSSSQQPPLPVEKPTARPEPPPQSNPAWEPPPARALKRDKDGAVLASGRRPGELAPLITRNDEFYIVSKNVVSDPEPGLDDWRLQVIGDVERPIQLDYANMRKLPAVEVIKTLECISNLVTKCELAPFGCDLIGTARWRGVRVADVLALAGGVKPGVISLATISADEYTSALPIEAALDPDTLLVYEMNGEILPREHGYPLRLLVPGRYGMKSAKWVVALRPMAREYVDWFGQRDWSKEGIIKTMTRIDMPARGATLPAGEHRVAGIAYGGDRGISKVEYSADGGQHWQVAELLEPSLGRDVWMRWQGRFNLEPGAKLTLAARATDGSGQLQTEAFSLPQPNGSSGWHTCDVRAG